MNNMQRFCLGIICLVFLIANIEATTIGNGWIQVTGSSTFSPREDLGSVVYDGKMWVIGGTRGVGYENKGLNDVWYSTDGINWKQATGSAAFPPRIGHSSVVFDNRIWVIGGSDSTVLKNDVWYSTDGTNWKQATGSAAFSPRERHSSIVYDNKMWVIGGYDGHYRNDTWYSTDGITWTEATTTANFPARNAQTSVVYNNKMWVIGGFYHLGQNVGSKNDTWYSSDGVTWKEATAAANFPARDYHTSVVYDNKMWVIGGRGNVYDYPGGGLNDVWSSTDGIKWTKNVSPGIFSSRAGHSSVIYDNRIWVLGGWDNGYKSDIWSYGNSQNEKRDDSPHPVSQTVSTGQETNALPPSAGTGIITGIIGIVIGIIFIRIKP
jgi:leucine-zipper-like transcriptional regulator 1